MPESPDFTPIAGLGQIADRYDAVMCDIWGVIHNGREAFAPAVEAMRRFRAEVGPVVMVSNSPRPATAIPAQFERVGIDLSGEGVFYDAIVTSGDATVDELSRRAPGPAFKLGPERDDPLYSGLELDFASMEDAAFIACTGLFDDETETPDDYRELLSIGVARDLPMVCANPDLKVVRGDREIYCGGALAQLYESLGGRTVYAGKPHAPIYRLSRAWLDEVTGHVPDPSRILFIGDNMLTDLTGANREGMDALLVQPGVVAKRDRLADLLRGHGITARWVCAGLVW